MYPSKILLFGEYTILLGSSALAVPFNKFKGELAFMESENNKKEIKDIRSNQVLYDLLRYLKMEIIDQITYPFDFDTFEKDLEKGLFFRSDIPEESGLGSSGAVVAAIFYRYTNINISDKDLPLIRDCLGLFESFFHGTSSGIDPLVSYLKSPVLIINKETYRISYSALQESLRKSGLFIFHIQKKGNTGEMVKNFKTRIKSDSTYRKAVTDSYMPVNDECIKSIVIDYNPWHFFSSIRNLTSFQLEIFEKMIPSDISLLTEYGLKNDLFFLKLCGSGGGGYYIGFTENIVNTEEYFNAMGYTIMIW
jgi:mevalonate kinase